MSNKSMTLYIGVTNNLARRVSAKEIELIKTINPTWADLSAEWSSLSS